MTGTTILDQSGPGSTGNKGVLPKSPELEPYNEMQFIAVREASFCVCFFLSL